MGDGRIGSTTSKSDQSGGRTGGARSRRHTWWGAGNRTVQRADANQAPSTNNRRSPYAIPRAPEISHGARLQRAQSSAKKSHDAEGTAEESKSSKKERKSSSPATPIQEPENKETHKMAREILSLYKFGKTDQDLSNLYAKHGNDFSERFFESLPGYIQNFEGSDPKNVTSELKLVLFGDAHQTTAEHDKVKKYNNYMLFFLIKLATFDALLMTSSIDKAIATLKSMIMCVLSNNDIDDYVEYTCACRKNINHRDPYLAWKTRIDCDESADGQWDSICKFLDDLVYCKFAVLRGSDNFLTEQVLSLLLLLGFLKKKD